jgi:hypothetical protein
LNNPKEDVGKGIPLRETDVLGDILKPGNYVNLVADVPGKGPTRLIERVFVLAVGGKGARPFEGGVEAPETGSTSYRTITIELSKKAAIDLEKVIKYVVGTVYAEFNPATDAPDDPPQVDQEIVALADSRIKTGGGGGVPPPR